MSVLPVKPSPGRRSRSKGGRGEREIVEQFHARGFTLARRNFGSGSAGGGDITGVPGTHIEVKRTERLELRKAWRQAASEAQPTDVVVVAHRCNGQPWLATIELDELLALLQLKAAA